MTKCFAPCSQPLGQTYCWHCPSSVPRQPAKFVDIWPTGQFSTKSISPDRPAGGSQGSGASHSAADHTSTHAGPSSKSNSSRETVLRSRVQVLASHTKQPVLSLRPFMLTRMDVKSGLPSGPMHMEAPSPRTGPWHDGHSPVPSPQIHSPPPSACSVQPSSSKRSASAASRAQLDTRAPFRTLRHCGPELQAATIGAAAGRPRRPAPASRPGGAGQHP
mmetsp:Transcript_92623/g.262003  ORF Transcript_92623/g.262003 Transcript_92623/m.262003 type:complete len:218 (+) Transcript_92623:1038-1691(+)